MCFALTMTDVLIQKATTEMNQRTLNVKRWLNDQQNLFIVRHPRWLKIIVMCKQFNSLALSDLALVWKKQSLYPCHHYAQGWSWIDQTLRKSYRSRCGGICTGLAFTLLVYTRLTLYCMLLPYGSKSFLSDFFFRLLLIRYLKFFRIQSRIKKIYYI